MALTSFRIADIPEEGLTLGGEVRPDELALEPGDAKVRRDLALSVEIARVVSGFSVKGVLSGTFLRACVRCLQEYEDPARLSFAVEYRRKTVKERAARTGEQPAPGDAAPEVHEQGDEVYPLIGDHLELAEMLREQIILATPMQPLCHEGCLGLCPVCGQDLNERRCGCPEARPESPFAVLQQRAGVLKNRGSA